MYRRNTQNKKQFWLISLFRPAQVSKFLLIKTSLRKKKKILGRPDLILVLITNLLYLTLRKHCVLSGKQERLAVIEDVRDGSKLRLKNNNNRPESLRRLRTELNLFERPLENHERRRSVSW